MSDPRFERLKTDPRFRRIRKKDAKVTIDERFKGILDKGKAKKSKVSGRVDKYGRAVSDNHEQENLRRFYRLENEDEFTTAQRVPDLARGEVLLESSDDDEEDLQSGEKDPETGDEDDVVTLGLHRSHPIAVPEAEQEIDLNEDNFVDLDAQAEAYAEANKHNETTTSIMPTKRLAVVNLDWDHVKAAHLYKIFSSLVSSTKNPLISTSNKTNSKGHDVSIVRGRVLSVRIFQSDFGKERMEREEREGPPPELFKQSKVILDEEEVDEKNIYDVGEEGDYNEDALRKYQLERLRYYYAIVVCDSVDVAAHIYSELEGTELERSANVFDMSFVPDDMTFDQDFHDEATEVTNAPFKPLDFTTDALRHSKVKLTWDQDDPERNRFTRRTLSRKEIEEDNFKAYIASSSSEDEAENQPKDKTSKKSAERDKLRALLLGGSQNDLPEGWGKVDDIGSKEDMDMEITFTPGLTDTKDEAEQTTLEKYQRKLKEKRNKRKQELKENNKDETTGARKKLEDDFFDDGSDGSSDNGSSTPRRKKEQKGSRGKPAPGVSVPEATAQELTLLVGSDNPKGEVRHFDMNAVLKAEKKGKRKIKGKKAEKKEEDNEIQEDFAIDLRDDRFKALHENHTFAIDPSNPHFKKTKSMTALLDERSKRQKAKHQAADASTAPNVPVVEDRRETNLQSLVENIKRKHSAAINGQTLGKRRKL